MTGPAAGRAASSTSMPPTCASDGTPAARTPPCSGGRSATADIPAACSCRLRGYIARFRGKRGRPRPAPGPAEGPGRDRLDHDPARPARRRRPRHPRRLCGGWPPSPPASAASPPSWTSAVAGSSLSRGRPPLSRPASPHFAPPSPACAPTRTPSPTASASPGAPVPSRATSTASEGACPRRKPQLTAPARPPRRRVLLSC